MCNCLDARRLFLLTRRTALSNALTLAFMSIFSNDGFAQRHTRARGCTLLAATGAPAPLAYLQSSGDSSIDEFCTNEVGTLSRVFQLKPTFGFFDDAVSPNAFAMAQAVRPENADGTILMGRRLARQSMPEATPHKKRQLAAVLAHEYGHLLQYKARFNEAWGIKFELTADFMAGWYLGRIHNLTKADIDQTAELFLQLGDTSFTDPSHHGTPWQRSKIFSRGAGVIGREFPTVDKPSGTAAEAFKNALASIGIYQ